MKDYRIVFKGTAKNLTKKEIILAIKYGRPIEKREPCDFCWN